MKNFSQMLKQAQQMQQKLQEAQQKNELLEHEGTSGGGMVRVCINGKGQMVKLKIDSTLINKDEADILEDLVIAAFNDAKTKMDEVVNKEMSGLMGGMNIPGLKLPF